MCAASVVAQMIKNLLAMQEARVPSLRWEDPLEKGMAIHSSILAWRISYGNSLWKFSLGRMSVAWQATEREVAVGHD